MSKISMGMGKQQPVSMILNGDHLVGVATSVSNMCRLFR